jgi:hypothetical protein
MKSKRVDKAQVQPVVRRPSHDPDTEAVFCAALCATLEPETIFRVLSRYINTNVLNKVT